jgi:HAD superfamily hydrolase (TIGR01509 family)
MFANVFGRRRVAPRASLLWMAYQALLLDLDDTLFDRSAALRAWAEVAVQTQLERPLTVTEWYVLVEIDGRGHRPREEFAAEARDRLGLEIDPLRFGHGLVQHLTLEPGAAETIAALAKRLRVGVVTNGGSAQRAKLDALGIAPHVVFVSAEVGMTKPALGIFERALRWTERAANEVLFVGDDPIIDLAPAASLGMHTAWRARGHEWPTELAPPTYCIEAITELAELCAT